MRNNLYIPSIDAKDLYISNNYINKIPYGYKITRKDGSVNLNKFINSFDYSLDLIELRDVAKSIYKKKDSLSFINNNKEYSSKIINVTFKYSVKEFNRVSSDLYVRLGYNVSESQLVDNKLIIDNVLVAIKLEQEMSNEIPDDIVPKYFKLTKNESSNTYKYILSGTIPNIVSSKELRNKLYKDGFICNGIKYVRFKRSSGSARVGKVLFIDSRLYEKMHISEQCGLNYSQGDSFDLAAFEAYIALPSSSIIDTIEIEPKNILVIDDFESVFKDVAVCTGLTSDNHLYTEEKNTTIKNSIWDGQSLIDISLMGNYSSNGMILLRNKFFKSCCFNTNIQEFFRDNNITDMKQLNGETIAEDISDIKLITTPSSIKFYKFGTLKTWLDNIYPFFGVVKHDKDTHFFDGKMVQGHYQLLNTLQLSKEEVYKIVQPGLDYLNKINTDPDVMRYHLKCRVDVDREYNNIMKTKNEMVYTLLNFNCGFENTKIYYDFKKDLCRSYLKNIKRGHVLIDGTYATLFGNPYEMLLQSIGKFDGNSIMDAGTVYNTRYSFGTEILGCRSPHVTIGNILVTTNKEYDEIAKYFNLTDKIICINSINENILERLSGADFDSDQLIITNNEIMINAAKKYYSLFNVPTRIIFPPSIKRTYTPESLSDLDFKTGTNKIGEIVNLSQELNSLLWNKVNEFGGDANKCFNKIKSIYYDVCQLDVMSNIEIDKAKKEYPINNGEELNIIRDKYKNELLSIDGKRKVMPKFLGFIAKTKGFYNSEAKDYQNYNTTMDYLLQETNKFRSKKSKGNDFTPLSEIFKLNTYNENSVKWSQIKKIIELSNDTANYIKSIAMRNDIDGEERHNLVLFAKEELNNKINKLKINNNTMYQLLKSLDSNKNNSIYNLLFHVLFNYKNDTLSEIINCKEKNYIEIEKCEDGNIEFYGIKHAKRSVNNKENACSA